MRNLISLSVVLATMAIFTSTSEAQFSDGFRFGTGVGFSSPFFGSRLSTREAPPYFAKFPPVYYSGIVRRPYGISPFAAPPGIAPVELSVPHRVTITNPFFDDNVAPVSNKEEKEAVDGSGNKVTWRPNPYEEILVNK